MNKAEMERLRAAAEAESIGPVGSAMILGPVDTIVLLKVKWSDELDRVVKLAEQKDAEGGIDVYTKWALHAPQKKISLSLEVGWPDLGVRAMLYFPLEKWSAELTIIEHCRGSFIMMADMKVQEAEEQGRMMTIDAEGSILNLVPALVRREDG